MHGKSPDHANELKNVGWGRRHRLCCLGAGHWRAEPWAIDAVFGAKECGIRSFRRSQVLRPANTSCPKDLIDIKISNPGSKEGDTRNYVSWAP